MSAANLLKMLAAWTLAAWFLVSFTACAPDKKSDCKPAWRMPDGTVCRYYAVLSAIGKEFRACDGGREYLNPGYWTNILECEKYK